jgi:hypothetical protein
MVRRLGKPLWIVPLIIAGFVAAFGWWGNERLRQTIETQLKDDLKVALNANVTALEIWTTNQMKLATALAEEPRFNELANQVLDHFQAAETGPRRGGPSPESEELATYLRPRLSRVGYEIAELVDTNFVVAANTMRGRTRRGAGIIDEHTAKFAELFTNGQPVLITPFKPARPPSFRPFPPGRTNGPREFRSDRTNGPSFRPPGSGGGPGRDQPEFARAMDRLRRGDLTLMQVAAPVRGSNGVVRAALALIIDPDDEFTRILSVARSGHSGETYAFDQAGLLISKSRFDDQLKTLGLIESRPDVSSALNLRLSDPGTDSPSSITPEETNALTRPLIGFVSAAVAGGSGVSMVPTRDYRGVPVVAAWRWLPGLGFGVATQIDATEAFEPLRVLKLVFFILVLLLLLSAVGMFLFSCLNLISRRRLTEAELKLKQLGQYTLEEKIGEGGMGVVYRARHALMRRDTAIKLLPPDKAHPEAIERFEREVCLTCQLTHPNTIQVYDYGHTPEGVFYFAMEYLVGLNLHDLVHRFGPLPEGRVVHILRQVCDSLAEAHALGLVHRDIKPANIFLCDRGGVPDSVKVLDFGLVRQFVLSNGDPNHATVEVGAVGTPSFMPPEAIQNPNLSDPRSDIYSVGALGYFLLTAQNVFEGDNVLDLYARHLKETPVPPSRRTDNPISPELERTLLNCLEKDPARRPADVVQLREQLAASPAATDWSPVARASWWNQYHREAGTGASARRHPTPIADATVHIDFASRMEE